MTYREVRPPPLLRAEVEVAWAADVAMREELDVLPDGCMDLMWSGTELFVAGPDTGPQPTSWEPGRTTSGLRFAPGRLPALLGVPATEVRDQRVPLAELHPRLARHATARLVDGADPATILVGLTVALPGSPVEPGMRAAAAYLNTGMSIADVADRLGWTARSLHRRSLAAFGYGPAVLRRVLRFRRARALLNRGVPIAEAAAVAGYADQPHLSREVRALTGLAPGQLANGANRSTPVPSGSRTVA